MKGKEWKLSDASRTLMLIWLYGKQKLTFKIELDPFKSFKVDKNGKCEKNIFLRFIFFFFIFMILDLESFAA